jgi:hypothetical protein
MQCIHPGCGKGTKVTTTVKYLNGEPLAGSKKWNHARISIKDPAVVRHRKCTSNHRFRTIELYGSKL